jgi:hypothetical protein
MAELPNDEFKELEGEQRHKELMAKLTAIAERPHESSAAVLEPLLEKHFSTIETITRSAIEAAAERKDTVIDLEPLITQINESHAEIVQLLLDRPAAPTSFKIERNSKGLITRIVAE